MLPLKPRRILQLGKSGSLYSLILLWIVPALVMPMSIPSVAIASLPLKSFNCSNLLAMSAEVTIQLAGPRRVVLWMMLATSRTL